VSLWFKLLGETMIRWHTYAQLVRLPNLPSALADIFLGALVTGALPQHWLAFLLLLPASACLYCGGMVWNDFFDVEQDKRERPFRPIPSGRVTRREAALLGVALLAGGVVFAFLAGWSQGFLEGAERSSKPGILALCLVASILLYDGWLKRTALGPVAMGTCRFLNVLLGVSASGTLAWPSAHLAAVVGLYIVGVTWFARTEARTNSQAALRGAAVVMLASLVLALPLPAFLRPGESSPLFPYLLVGLGFLLGLPVWQAISAPTPTHVQSAVKRCLMGLILLDAVLATALAGTVGLVILALLLPSLYLNYRKGLYAT
jgi:4-hydroxybenzoate polyprenyltransferase